MGELFRTEGPLALHRGALPTLLRQGTQLGFRFALYSDIKNGIDYVFAGSKREGTLGGIQNFVQTMVSGASVGVLGTILNNPLDVIKTRINGREAKEHSEKRSQLYSGRKASEVSIVVSPLVASKLGCGCPSFSRSSRNRTS